MYRSLVSSSRGLGRESSGMNLLGGDRRLKSVLAENPTPCPREKLFQQALFVLEWVGQKCWCSSVVEQLICNQPVAGSNPITSFNLSLPIEL